jgi:signal peptidase I
MIDNPDYPSQSTSGTVDVPSTAPGIPAAGATSAGPTLPEVKTVDVKSKREPEQKKSLVREYFESAVVTLVMALFGMTFIVQAVKVPTGSMKNTIWIQDHLLVNKFIYGSQNGVTLPVLPSRQIRRGDIVVFKYPSDPQTNFVKRVVGLPGETLEYDAETGRVFINGQELPENRLFVKRETDPESPEPLEQSSQQTNDGREPGAQWTVYYYEGNEFSVASRVNNSDAKYAVRQPFKIPLKGDPVPDEDRSDPQHARIYDNDGDGRFDSDQYFCMGDNRDNSSDSRIWGTVPRASIVGRAMLVYWSLDKSKTNGEEPNLITEFLTKSRLWRIGTFIK